MKGLHQDFRYALRVLIKNPAFTIIAAITLALGIGVNATVFSIANAYLFRPLPVRAPGELMAVATKTPSIEIPVSVSYLDYTDVQQLSTVFSDAIAFENAPVSMSTTGRSERGTFFRSAGESIWLR